MAAPILSHIAGMTKRDGLKRMECRVRDDGWRLLDELWGHRQFGCCPACESEAGWVAGGDDDVRLPQLRPQGISKSKQNRSGSRCAARSGLYATRHFPDVAQPARVPPASGADPLSRPTIILSGLASSAQDCRTFRE
jgi:hypothetical protein